MEGELSRIGHIRFLPSIDLMREGCKDSNPDRHFWIFDQMPLPELFTDPSPQNFKVPTDNQLKIYS